MFHKEVEPCHSDEHEEGIGPSILRKADVVGHEGQRQSTGEGDRRRERSCKEIEHGNGEGSKDQRDDPQISFGLGKRVESVGEDEEEGRMKKGGVLPIEFDLTFEIIPGIIVGMDLIHPERFLIKGVKPQGKGYYKKTKYQNQDLFLFYRICFGGINIH